MAKLDITLSRAHKIAERLKTKASEHASESERLSASVDLSGSAGAQQVERLRAQGRKSLELSASSERLLRVAAHLRSVIAHENEKRSINALLARADAVNRMITSKKSIIEQAKDGSITLDEIGAYAPFQEGASLRSHSVRVNVFTDAERDSLQTDLGKLQREAFALADQVAEANAARFTLELDDDIATEVTGA